MRMVSKDMSSGLRETTALYDECVTRNVLLLHIFKLCF